MESVAVNKGGRPKRGRATVGKISVYPIFKEDHRRRKRVGYQAAVRVRRADGSETQLKRQRPTREQAHDAVSEAAQVERTKTARTPTATETETVVSVTDKSSVAELCAAYANWLAAGDERSEATMTQYRWVVRKILKPGLSDLAVEEATTAALEAFSNDLPASTWRATRSVLGGSWKWALRRGEITTPNPVPGTRTAPVPRPTVTTVTPDQLKALIARAELYRDATGLRGPKPPRQPWLVHMLPVALATGARVSELLRMQWSDVEGLDGDGPVVVTLRGSKQRHRRGGGEEQTRPRRLTLAPFAAAALREQRKDLGEFTELCDYVWPTVTGKPLQDDAVARALYKTYDYQPAEGDSLPPLDGERVTIHVLRHTVGTWVAHHPDGGLQTAAAFLGHVGGSVTEQHYVAPQVADVAKIVESTWAG